MGVGWFGGLVPRSHIIAFFKRSICCVVAPMGDSENSLGFSSFSAAVQKIVRAIVS